MNDVASSPSISFPPPSVKSLIIDGAISGFLPDAHVLAVHYPGYPSSATRAIETLSGLPKIAKAWSCALQNLGGPPDPDKDRRRCLELKFRPEDPYCHPAFGEPHPSSSLLLRISQTKSGNASDCAEQVSADVVARVSLMYHFEGMADYQHVLIVRAAESRRKKRPWTSNEELFSDDDHNLDMDCGDVMKLVPPLFARKDKPEKIVLNPPSNLVSENLQKSAVEYTWEMDMEPCHAISFSIDTEKINWEDKLPKGTIEWKAQLALSKLFEERPIWPRLSLYERLLDDGHEVSEYLLRRLLLRVGYYFSHGPFDKFWIRKGYDPRGSPASRIRYQKVDFRKPPNFRDLNGANAKSEYQKVDFRKPPNFRDLNGANAKSELKYKWKHICKFQVWPLKVATCLQLFELDDACIHQEIEKAPTLISCSPKTGWFSETTLKSLRLHVMKRFMELIPEKASEEFMKSKIEHLKRCKKKETLSKVRKPEKEHCNDIQDASQSQDLQIMYNNVECEQVQNDAHQIEDEVDEEDQEEEEEEEEEELDGYELPHMVGEDDVPRYVNNHEMGGIIPNEYLQELLSGFSYSNTGKSKLPDEEASEDEYQIYGQDSDDEPDFN